jgi:hypothetical protein
MRDVGLVVWVALLFIGVVGSMISSLRRQAQARPQFRPHDVSPPIAPSAQQRRQVIVRTAPPAPERKPAPVPAPVAPPAAAVEHIQPARLRRRLFSDRREVVRAVIAAEVLGKPRGLSDEYHRV